MMMFSSWFSIISLKKGCRGILHGSALSLPQSAPLTAPSSEGAKGARFSRTVCLFQAEVLCQLVQHLLTGVTGGKVPLEHGEAAVFKGLKDFGTVDPGDAGAEVILGPLGIGTAVDDRQQELLVLVGPVKESLCRDGLGRQHDGYMAVIRNLPQHFNGQVGVHDDLFAGG